MSFAKYLISKQFRNQLIIAALLLGFGFYGLVTWLKITTNHNQQIQVPDLTKLDIEEVKTKLLGLNLRYEVIDSASYNPSYPKRSVISQSPDSGSFVKEHRNIYLTLNPSKYGKVQIQEFYGKTKYEVIAQLKSSGFKIGKILFIPDIGKNVVRKLSFNGKTLNEGEKLEQQSVIDITLGNGKGR